MSSAPEKTINDISKELAELESLLEQFAKMRQERKANDRTVNYVQQSYTTADIPRSN